MRGFGHRSRHSDGEVSWLYRQRAWAREPVLGPDGAPRLVPAVLLISPDGRKRLVPSGGSDQHGALPPLVLLDQWVQDWISYGAGDHQPVPTMSSQCGWLSVRLDWACEHHPAIDDFADELRRRVYHVLRGVLGLTEERQGSYVGRCPMPCQGGGLCETSLWVDPYTTRICCGARGCSGEWDRSKHQWVSLVAAQEAAGLARWQEKESA